MFGVTLNAPLGQGLLLLLPAGSRVTSSISEGRVLRNFLFLSAAKKFGNLCSGISRGSLPSEEETEDPRYIELVPCALKVLQGNLCLTQLGIF